MRTNDIIKLIVTLTLSFAFLTWGWTLLSRNVVDRNYHAPTPQQIKMQAYQDCANGAGTKPEDCRKIVGD